MTITTGALFVALELGCEKWVLASVAQAAQKPRFRSLSARNLGAFREEIAKAKARFGLSADAPVFTWAGARGPSQWVQYTFPDDQEVSRVDVFWIRPPDSWRLVYQVNGEWKEVAARGAYGTTAGAFTSVEFTPVKTMAMRIEAAFCAHMIEVTSGRLSVSKAWAIHARAASVA